MQGHTKDLENLGLPIDKIIFIDVNIFLKFLKKLFFSKDARRHLVAYPENSLHIKAFIGDLSDNVLYEMAEFLVALREFGNISDFYEQWSSNKKLSKTETEPEVCLSTSRINQIPCGRLIRTKTSILPGQNIPSSWNLRASEPKNNRSLSPQAPTKMEPIKASLTFTSDLGSRIIAHYKIKAIANIDDDIEPEDA